MKKLFSYLMIAATVLFASCGTESGTGTGTGNEGGGNTEKPFYGFTVDGADVSAIGGDDYIIQMYILDESGNTSRLMSAHATIPGVVDDVLPQGTFELKEGEIGDTGMYFKGSFYENASAENGYYMLVTKGEVEIKHTADGYRVTVYADGINAETGNAINNIECRYEGDLEIVGNALPYVADSAYAVYLGVEDNVHWWVFEYDVNEDYYVDLYILTDTSFEEGIPSGKYPFAMTGAAGTAVPSYNTGQGYGGSMLVVMNDGQGYIADLFLGGEINIVNNGDGTFSVDALYYSYYNIPSVASYEGTATYYDQTAQGGGGAQGGGTEVVAMHWGGPNWSFYLIDYTNELISYLDSFNGNSEGTFEEGIKAGTYTYTEDTNNYDMTIWAPIMQDGQWTYYGSVIFNLSQNQILDIVTDATMVVTDNEDGTHAITANVSGTQFTDYTFEFNGEVYLQDGNAAQVSAKAPLKVAAKAQMEAAPKFNKENKEVSFKRNIAR